MPEQESSEKRQKRLEYHRRYNEIHSERICSQISENHRTNNKWNLWRLQKYSCECGQITSNHNKYRHVRTLKHIKWVNDNIPQIINVN